MLISLALIPTCSKLLGSFFFLNNLVQIVKFMLV